MHAATVNDRVEALSRLRSILPSNDLRELSKFSSEVSRLAALVVCDQQGLNASSIATDGWLFSIHLKNGSILNGEVQGQQDKSESCSFNDANLLIVLGSKEALSTDGGNDLNLSSLAYAQMVLEEKVSALFHWPRPQRIEFLEKLAATTGLPRSLIDQIAIFSDR